MVYLGRLLPCIVSGIVSSASVVVKPSVVGLQPPRADHTINSRVDNPWRQLHCRAARAFIPSALGVDLAKDQQLLPGQDDDMPETV